MYLENWRELVCAEARTWLGTRYHHAAQLKGVGVDCAMLLCAVYKTVGVIAPDYDPRPYAQHWYLHRSEEIFMNSVFTYAKRIDVPQPGDVAMYRFGRTASHGAIVVEDDNIIHASAWDKATVIQPRKSLERRCDSYWTVR